MIDVAAAIACFERGGVLLYPTHTLWGLGGDGRRTEVHTRIQTIKGRTNHAPFLVLLRSSEQAPELVTDIPPRAQRMMDALWPCELTLLLPARKNIPKTLVGSEGLVGIRVATHPVPQAILKATSGWLVSTSANHTGEPEPSSLSNVPDSIRKSVDCVVMEGPSPPGIASSIVAFPRNAEPRIIRVGAVPIARMQTALEPQSASSE